MQGNLRLLNGRKLLSPLGGKTRPTTARVREALINIIGHNIKDSSWLDLFSGSGVIGCEAIQRGAKRVLAIESNKKAAKVSELNLFNSSQGLNHRTFVEVKCKDSIEFLKLDPKKLAQKYLQEFPADSYVFDFVYIDPPYHLNIYSEIIRNLLKGGWINHKSMVVCEHLSDKNPIEKESWIIQKQKNYGKSALSFITPTQA